MKLKSLDWRCMDIWNCGKSDRGASLVSGKTRKKMEQRRAELELAGFFV